MRTRWTIFSAETFVLLLYRGRNLRGFLRVVTDRADLLPIEIFRGCVQEVKLSSWPPEAHIEPQNRLLGQPSACAEDPEDSKQPLRGHFQELRSCKEPRPGTCRRAGPSTRSVCCGHSNRRWPSHDEGDA